MTVGITYSNAGKLQPYLEALRSAGLEPVPLHYGQPASVSGLHGLVMSGGPDLDPSLYGQKPDGSEEPVRERDTFELALLGQALHLDIPILCICRGLQLFNVFHGGTLYQHLANTDVHRQRETLDAHEVSIEPNSLLAHATGDAPKPVNSRHHQAVHRVGCGLVVSARSPDGIIEGLERPGRRLALAVQWHPEDRVQADERDRRLFAAFARAVGV
jgi:gamma-glutamyl-gamma-aminobutyrate hydrolase PuuD